LPYSQEDQFDLPSGFDPCHSDDDMQIVDGPPDSADEIIEQIFE
jgi:hypothetical protein